MPQTPREIVHRTLDFEHPDRLARDLWLLPWATLHHADAVAAIRARYPPDIVSAPNVYRPSGVRHGDPHAVGEYVDEWGCTFVSVQAGAIGEVRVPSVTDASRWREVRPPYEMLPDDVAAAADTVARHVESTDRFVMAGCCPRPWERYQFLRGSCDALTDLLLAPEDLRRLLRVVHDFYLRELEFWVRTPVDGFTISDDWGMQRQLFIDVAMWRDIFKPLYKDYCALARAHGKRVFMHSDGWITSIIDDLIEVGVEALNAQIFCMDLAELGRRFKGRVTFWGEIDRQHVLPSPDPEVGRRAVREAAAHLYAPAGGIIAQIEFGLGAHPDTALAVYDEWERWDRRARLAG